MLEEKFLLIVGENVVKNSYKILPNEKIIIETYSGTFSLISFIKLKRKEFFDKDYNNSYDYIVDFSGVYFPDYQRYQDIVYFLELYVDKLQLSKCALITQNPNQVVESVLFSMEAEKILPISFKVFSGIKPAFSWIHGDFTESYHEKIVITNN